MRIDILVGNNLYSSTTSFAQSLHEAFKVLGVESRLFWIDDGMFFQAFYEISSHPPDLTCSFSDIRLGNRPLADLWNIPHLSLLVDPVIYFLHHLKSPLSWLSCVDEEDVSFVNALGFKNAFFLPHGTDEKEKTSPDCKRRFEKVFFGSCIDVDHVVASWNEKYAKKERSLLHEACKEVLSPAGISPLKALCQLGVTEKELPSMHHEVDLFVRGVDRIELLKKQDVHIWGSGPWEKYCPQASLHAPIAFADTLNIMKQSKLVFNSSARFKNGSHERILYSLMCGACPVTHDNGFVKKFFKSAEMMTYQLGEWKVEQDLSEWQTAAWQGQKRVILEHTWKDRAERILKSFSFQKI